jgi:hypothetical protein
MDKIIKSAIESVTQYKNQVYPLAADETAQAPYCVYCQSKNTPLTTLDGSTGAAIVEYEAHCMAAKYGQSVDLAKLTAKALEALGSQTADGFIIQSADIVGVSPQQYVGDLNVYRSTCTVSFFVSEV